MKLNPRGYLPDITYIEMKTEILIKSRDAKESIYASGVVLFFLSLPFIGQWLGWCSAWHCYRNLLIAILLPFVLQNVAWYIGVCVLFTDTGFKKGRKGP